MPLKTEEKKLFLTLIIVLIASVLAMQYMLVSAPTETYTEVYFETPTPETVSQGDEFTVVFTIASHEGFETAYVYNVSLDGAAVAEGEFSLIPRENKNIQETISASESGRKKTEVRVTAATNKNNGRMDSIRNYEIHFWIEVI